MKWRNLVILAGVFALLFSYVYFYEIKGEKKREEAEEKAKKLFQFEEKDIAQIDLKNSEGELSLQKDKDGWRLLKPVEAKADKSSCDSLAGEGCRVQREPGPGEGRTTLERTAP